MTKKKKEKKIKEKPTVHEELKGFEIGINSFGEVVPSVDIDKLNEFLNEHVEDLKLRHLKEKDEEE